MRGALEPSTERLLVAPDRLRSATVAAPRPMLAATRTRVHTQDLLIAPGSRAGRFRGTASVPHEVTIRGEISRLAETRRRNRGAPDRLETRGHAWRIPVPARESQPYKAP